VLFEVLGTKQNSLFTGDTLFIGICHCLFHCLRLSLLGGCGKFFEGSAKDMNYALNEVVAGLADNTLIWCGHEYTCSNLAFALSVDPDNKSLQVSVVIARSI
jgi:hydroxyacylglutathione hydrolase